jgi:hypothetical protein
MPTPTATATALLRAEAREQARVDLFAERLKHQSRDRLDYLLHNENGRDHEIFELMGTDPEITVDEYGQIPVEERDPNWVAGLSAMVRACTLQVLAERKDKLIELLVTKSENLNKINISDAELREAATNGISKKEIAAARKELLDGS